MQIKRANVMKILFVIETYICMYRVVVTKIKRNHEKTTQNIVKDLPITPYLQCLCNFGFDSR